MASVRSQLVTTPPGGPSTITGAVYQMLWCLLRTLQLNVAEVERDGAGVITRATLILEPRGGGDVHELGEARRRVIQLKTRSGGRSWSLRDVIVGVFPDLYRSVNLSAEDSSYDFVTDADMGEWPDVYAFFQSLRDRIPAEAQLEQLDDKVDLPFARRLSKAGHGGLDDPAKSFWQQSAYTQRSMFRRIIEHLRQNKALASGESIETTRRKLWHLLGRFRFIGKQALSQLEAEIDALLSALVDHPEQVTEKRNALLGWLACHARAGNAILQTDNVLQEHGLDVTPLTDWSTLRAKAIDLYRRLIELRQYNESFDVRRREVAQFRSGWGPEKPLLGITGESGDGKSWALLALGLHMSADPAVVMLVDATGTADGTLRRAAEFFWQEVKGHGTAPPLSVIARQLKKVLPKRAGFWMTLLVDGVQSRSEAEQLARRPLEDWGVRLAVTGPPDVVKVFQNAAAGRAKVVTVDAFTPTQRDDYLQRRLGDAWVRIPADIRDTLRRPLLANIYCEQVAIEKGWNPTHEYDLYDVMWERLRTGAHNPGTYDATRLARLAATVLDDVTYPWPAGGLEQAGIEEIAVKSLCRAGWVRRNADGKYEVPHDRLLNYAVARGLVEAYELDKTGEDRLIQTLRQLLFDPRAWSGRRLGYVPMDVFYIMLREPTGLDPCARWLAALDDMGHIERESLYVDLLPTLGTRALPLLFARLEACEGADALYRQHPIIEGINACATAGTHLLIRQLLNSDNPRLHRAALKILATHPDPSVLDRLWQLHGQMLGDPVRYGERADFHVNLYQDSMDALRACAELEPSWIERMVRATPAALPYIHDLAYLLAGASNGAEIWRRCKAELIEKVPAGKIRSIIVNVGRYRDGDELHRLPPLVGQDADSVGPAAVQAIARIDPDAAVEHLVRLSGFEMYLARHWFLDRLLEVRRADVNGKLLAHMRESDDVWTIAAVYSGNEQEVDVETLEFLLDELDALLVHTAESPPPPNQHPLSRPLQLLAAMNRLDLLECLRRRQGSPLEQHLADFLIATGPRDGRGVDPPEQECAFAVLSKIGGAAFERVVNHCLVHGVHFGRLRAIAAAHRCEGIEVVQHLADIAASAESSEASSLEQEKATEALACLG